MLPGLLSVLIFFPALGALALLLLRSEDHVWIRRLALTISLVEFIFSLLLIPRVPMGVAGYSLVEYYNWIANPPIHYHLGVDGISLFLVILTTFLTPLSILASWQSINHRVKEFFVMLLLLEVVDAAVLRGVLCVLVGPAPRDALARHVRPASDHCRPQQRTSPPEHVVLLEDRTLTGAVLAQAPLGPPGGPGRGRPGFRPQYGWVWAAADHPRRGSTRRPGRPSGYPFRGMRAEAPPASIGISTRLRRC